MQNFTLLKSQQNEILRLAHTSKLDLGRFEWSVVPSVATKNSAVSRLSYRGTEFFFLFDYKERQEFASFSPGKDKLVDLQYPGSWAGQLECCLRWLAYLDREMNEPDLWSQIARHKLPARSALVLETSNEPFTNEDTARILSGLRQLRAHLAELTSASAEQTTLVNEELDYLQDALKRQGRRDWIHTAIGVVVTIVVGLALNAEQARAVWDLLGDAVRGIFGYLP